MDGNIDIAKDVYCRRNKLHTPTERNNVSLKFLRYNDCNEAIFMVRNLNNNKRHSWKLVKNDLSYLNDLTIDKEFPRINYTHRLIADVVKQRVKGFESFDVSHIVINKDCVHVYTNPKSYIFKGNFKIRRK